MQVKVSVDFFKGSIAYGSPSISVKEGDIIEITQAEWQEIQVHYPTWFTAITPIIEEVKAIEFSPENKMVPAASKRKRITDGMDRTPV